MLKQVTRRFTRLIFSLLAGILLLILAAIFVLLVFSFRAQTEDTLRLALSSSRYFRAASGESQKAPSSNPLPLGAVIALYDASGQQLFLAAPPDLEESVISEALSAARLSGKLRGTLTAGGRRFCYGRRFVSGTVRIALVDLSQQSGSTRNALLILLGVGVIALALLWLVSRFVAQKAVQPVQEAFERQEDFIADASHELKTPLAIVGATLSAVESDPAATIAAQKRWFDEIHRQCGRMKGLIDDMLTLARLDTGPQAIAMAPLELSTLAEGTALSFEALLFERGIGLEERITPAVFVQGSESSLTQLLTILLENACKHTPAGGLIRLTLSSVRGRAVLTVQNTGEGIPPEHLTHIFDRFYRVDSGRSRQEGGYGLGLSIAQSIVQAHHGTLSAASKPGDTTFTAELPLCDPPSQSVSQIQGRPV